MSIFDELKGKAEGLKDKAAQVTRESADQAHGVVDNAGNVVDEKTGGKFAEHIDKTQDAAHGLLDKVDSDDEGTTATPPAQPTPPA